MKKSLIAMSFGLFCLFCSPAPLTAQDGDNGIAPIQTEQPTLRPVLRRGSFGDEVMELQMRLENLGFKPGRPDGDFGPKTEAAVKIFQRDHSLPVDGVVDQVFWAKLEMAEESGWFEPSNPNPDPNPTPPWQPEPFPHPVEPGIEPGPDARVRPGLGPYSAPDDVIQLGNGVAFNIIGKTEQEAERLVALINDIMATVGSRTQLQLRVVSENGRDLMVTEDYRFNRLNLTINDGIIVSVDIR